jgi:glycosyltransferase EpsD
MKKILFVANTHKHFSAFHIPYIQYLQSIGYEVHVAANDPKAQINEADKQYNLPINRNPFSINNVKATRQLEKIIEKENYCLLHCHTAMGSVVARLAAKKVRLKGSLKVIYTAHGFHFYKGSPKIYWALYFPIEKYLSQYTDGIITMNEEDYNVVTECRFAVKNVFKTSGVGINSDKFKGISAADKNAIRAKNGFSTDTFIILYIAELINRKDHKFILESIPSIKEKISNFKFIFAGRGILKEATEEYARQQGVADYVVFLGFRKDIGELIMMADIGVSVSKQEGLPMNLAEEMYAEKPVVASNIRGHADLIDNGENGYLFSRGDKNAFAEKIANLYYDKELYNRMSGKAKSKSTIFELSNCLEEMKIIYNKFL